MHPEKVLVPIQIYGIDLSINTEIAIMIGVSIFVFLFLFTANKIKRFRQIEEFIFDYIYQEMSQESTRTHRIWFSFLITLFLFILFNNINGLIPGSLAPTSNINTTSALAISVFLLSQFIGIHKYGLKHFLYIIPKGIPKPMYILIFPLEIISQLARPFSLAVRLFANMFAGHKILDTFLSFVINSKSFLQIVPFMGVILLSLFEIFVALIQSFIFTYLTALYITETLEGQH